MSGPELRVHKFLPSSRANGPGLRAVVWVQGCPLGCPGCYNPETHQDSGGELLAVDTLFEMIAARGDDIEGLTVSGGEPLEQRSALAVLLDRNRRETKLSAILFTGYRWKEVLRMPEAGPILGCLDVLIAGRYDASRRLARSLRGSANKTVHFLTGRYGPADLDSVPPAEVIIAAGGLVEASGIEPIKPS